MEITTVYQKERHEFGRDTHTFAPSDVFILDEFLPDSDTRQQHIERNPTILDIQAIPDMSETYVSCAAADAQRQPRSLQAASRGRCVLRALRVRCLRCVRCVRGVLRPAAAFLSLWLLCSLAPSWLRLRLRHLQTSRPSPRLTLCAPLSRSRCR